jgi:hypothetical protein
MRSASQRHWDQLVAAGSQWIRWEVCVLYPNPATRHSYALHKPRVNIENRVRKLISIPNLVFSLHSADGELLPDDLSLRDLGIPSGSRLDCRIRTDEPAAPADADGSVRELIRRMEAGPHATRGPPSGRTSAPGGGGEVERGRLRSHGDGGADRHGPSRAAERTRKRRRGGAEKTPPPPSPSRQGPARRRRDGGRVSWAC